MQISDVTAAPQEVLDLATEWVYRGGMRDTQFIDQNSWTPRSDVVHTFTSSPESNLSLADFVAHLGDVPPRSSETTDSATKVEEQEGQASAARPTDTSITGFVAGDTAWTTHLIVADMLQDGKIEVRCSVVMLRLDGVWKVVHCHVSEGVFRDLQG